MFTFPGTFERNSYHHQDLQSTSSAIVHWQFGVFQYNKNRTLIKNIVLLLNNNFSHVPHSHALSLSEKGRRNNLRCPLGRENQGRKFDFNIKIHTERLEKDRMEFYTWAGKRSREILLLLFYPSLNGENKIESPIFNHVKMSS